MQFNIENPQGMCFLLWQKTHSLWVPKNCVAAMKLCVFRCVASAAHFLQKEEMQMKKVISLLLALVMCLSLCACGDGNDTLETTPNAENESTSRFEENEVTEEPEIDKEILGEWYYVKSTAIITLTFNEDGTGVHDQEGTETAFTWKYDEELNCYTIALGAVISATVENIDGIEQLIIGDGYCVRAEYYTDAHEDYLASTTVPEIILPTMEGLTAESNNPTEEQGEALYMPYIGKWVCSDGYYVIVNEDGTIVYNDVEYTPAYFEMGNGIAVYLENAEYTYYAGMDKNGEVYVTAKGCVFVWGLTERFGEGVMVGDHDGRKFILQEE